MNNSCMQSVNKVAKRKKKRLTQSEAKHFHDKLSLSAPSLSS